MRIKLLNIEHGIGLCNTKDIPEWVSKFGPAEEVAFFYIHQRDYIVLNEDNPNFELYKIVVEQYEDFSDLSKKNLQRSAKTIFLKLRRL